MKLYFFGLLIIAFFLISSCCENGVRTETRTLPKSEWIGMLNTTFSDISVQLNNFTPTDHEFRSEDEFAYFKPNDSFLRIGSLGIDFGINIPVQRNDPYSSYINDVRSQRIVPDTRRNKALVTIFFEDEGDEIIGNCVNNLFCVCGDPRINLNDLNMEMLLDIGAEDGRMVINSIDANLNSTFEETGPCRDNVCAFACDIFAPDRESEIKSAVENEVESFFTANRFLVEEVFNEHLERLGVTETITGAFINAEGGLELILESADPECEGM